MAFICFDCHKYRNLKVEILEPCSQRIVQIVWDFDMRIFRFFDQIIINNNSISSFLTSCAQPAYFFFLFFVAYIDYLFCFAF